MSLDAGSDVFYAARSVNTKTGWYSPCLSAGLGYCPICTQSILNFPIPSQSPNSAHLEDNGTVTLR